jgi:cystathionine beta-lyase
MSVFEKNNCIVFSAKIWSDLILDGHRHVPTQSVSEYARHHCIACYAPSKTFSLAGLIGSYHIIRDAGLKKAVDDTAAKTGYNHMNVLSMHALTGAYSQEGEEWLEELLKVLSGNVHYACDFIAAHFPGVSVSVPEGTYMIFLDCEEYCRNKKRDMDDLLKAGIAAGVIWQDGRTFGGTHTIRMNLAVPFSRLQDAFARLDRSVF